MGIVHLPLLAFLSTATYRAPWPAPPRQVAGVCHHGHWCAGVGAAVCAPLPCQPSSLLLLPLFATARPATAAGTQQQPLFPLLPAPAHSVLSFPLLLQPCGIPPPSAVYSHNVDNMEVELKTRLGTVTVPYGYPRGNYRTMVYALASPQFSLCPAGWLEGWAGGAHA